jgi:putative oxidoreductase
MYEVSGYSNSSNMKRENILSAISICIGLMFLYAAQSKLMDYDKSRQEMLNQIFTAELALVLTWLIPAIELIIVGLLLIKSLNLIGLYASAILLTTFSIYISITMTGVFGRIPCSCGGILKHMSYGTHLAFNFLFIVLALFGIAIQRRWQPINRWFDLMRKEAYQN